MRSQLLSERGSITIDQTHELNSISAPAGRNPRQPRLKLFLSYSHKDAKLCDIFRENLALLEEDGLIAPWFDGQILASAEWDKEIRRELEEADIVVFLVSTPFLGSKYIRGSEMSRALERRKAGGAELVAVILEAECNWRGREFTRYQAVPHGILPRGIKAVHSWRRPRDAFNNIETQLRQLITQMQATRATLASA